MILVRLARSAAAPLSSGYRRVRVRLFERAGRGARPSAGDHLPGGGVHRVRHGHLSWGTIALILPIIIGVFDAADPLFLVAVGSALARCGLRRSYLAYLRYDDSVLGRCEVQPPAPRGHADSLRDPGHDRVLRGLCHRWLHEEPLDLAGAGRSAHRDRRAGAYAHGGVEEGEGIAKTADRAAAPVKVAAGWRPGDAITGAVASPGRILTRAERALFFVVFCVC